MSKQPVAAGAVAALVGSVAAANALTATLGFVQLGPLTVPAGSLMAAVPLIARDVLAELGYRGMILAAIAAGAAVSAVLSPAVALASAVAFTVAELADWGAYSRLRRSGRGRAVLGSQLVGSVVDSSLFLALAFGPAAVAFVPVASLTAVKMTAAVPAAWLGRSGR